MANSTTTNRSSDPKANWFRLFLLVMIVIFAAVAAQKVVREYWGRINDERSIRDYLKFYQVRKLQLGAGGNDPAGWLNTDIEPASKKSISMRQFDIHSRMRLSTMSSAST